MNTAYLKHGPIRCWKASKIVGADLVPNPSTFSASMVDNSTKIDCGIILKFENSLLNNTYVVLLL